MASKVLMGNMPELVENIPNNLNNEIYSLYSCALVNRHLCKMSIPILWKDPFSLERRPSFISSYFFIFLRRRKHCFKRIWNKQKFQHLILHELLISDNAIALLMILAKISTKISVLEFDQFEYFDNDDTELQLINALSALLNHKSNLDCLAYMNQNMLQNSMALFSVLESQENSLQEVVLTNCSYNKEFEALKNCKNLETLRYCDYMIMLKILDYNKISTLEIKHLVLLSKHYIPQHYEYYVFPQLLELIGNLQNLQFLTLRCNIDILEEEVKIRVLHLAEILPLILQYFDVEDTWLKQYIDILLNHCNAPLKKSVNL
ncbi:hypothetical protein F8M41_022001 [Gigaspora margarita]|uniref:Uncharacterized protein n=1 Tax=Gigaspora margarita TaxID=4874 RepID=A0A8H4AFT4_GIGMA|nr:hypothetical protein F8M41_022001 [Gigaspora margarita]